MTSYFINSSSQRMVTHIMVAQDIGDLIDTLVYLYGDPIETTMHDSVSTIMVF